MASVKRNSAYSGYNSFQTQNQQQPLAPTVPINSVTNLLETLHNAYIQEQPYTLDATLSLVVSSWRNTKQVVDTALVQRAWEHATRRAEDGCLVLANTHLSTPSTLETAIHALPVQIPHTLDAALTVIKALTCHSTPANHSTPCYAALSTTVNFTLDGSLRGLKLAVPVSGVNIAAGLTKIPEKSNSRVFNAFYYLFYLTSTQAEKEFLNLKGMEQYTLLKRPGRFDVPDHLPSADDAAAAQDFKESLRLIGIKGATYRNFFSILTAILKLGDATNVLVDGEEVDAICEEVADLLDLEPEFLIQKCTSDDRYTLMSLLYRGLIDLVVSKANLALEADIIGEEQGEEDADTISLTFLDVPCPKLSRAIILRGAFDDDTGLNAEMREDGLELPTVRNQILKEAQTSSIAHAADLDGDETDHQPELWSVESRLRHKFEAQAGLSDFLASLLCLSPETKKLVRCSINMTLMSSRVWYHLSLHPTDQLPETFASTTSISSIWTAKAVSRQIRDFLLVEWCQRRMRKIDFTSDFDIEELTSRYASLGCHEGREGVEHWLIERGWSNGEAVIGQERVWIRESPWWELETMLDIQAKSLEQQTQGYPQVLFDQDQANPFEPSLYAHEGNQTGYAPTVNESGYLPYAAAPFESQERLLQPEPMNMHDRKSMADARSMARTTQTRTGDYGLGVKGDDLRDYEGDFDDRLDPEMGEPKHITQQSMSFTRRIWVSFVWMLTFWIPSFVLKYVGRIRRPDVRMAWREKVVIVFLILLLNATIVFYIVAFGKLLCPNFDKAWNADQVAQHTGNTDFYVSVRGSVYDISTFWRLQHSDTNIQTGAYNMEPFAGMNLDELFPVPLTVACPGLVSNTYVRLLSNNTPSDGTAVHTSGPTWQTDTQSALYKIDWYNDVFVPKIQEYYKGSLVVSSSEVYSEGQNSQKPWFILDGRIYDLSDYMYTTNTVYPDVAEYAWMPPDVLNVIEQSYGEDLTSQWGTSKNFTLAKTCLDNQFFVGIPDFRQSARCQVNNYILLAVTIILCAVILIKFLAALRFGSKKKPIAQNKFVICQVPVYTEGEDQLRTGLDSLTALEYDNKRKLLFVICDGLVTGGGNDRPTPKIVLDILGVDPKIDPPALAFRSVGEANEQLNYGKVYSGLYEFEGNVVPYVVVVKVGKPSEQNKSKPGNRGKRDSQVLLMRFLNRVQHRSAMSPLELELFHQINNIIGIDPELYEYIFMVDADTSVRADSLNRLVAACANDNKIAGICGETHLQNEGRSWWTMIQVYEYFISHHLSKAFESLFGSVTCLPGCFSMYRIRTADKGRPLIISDKVIQGYSDGQIDTLHKKNLLALGEDRYLTTLMTKHFPKMSYKFVAGAYAATAAPESFSVLLSQRRRWINSTIHNLGELLILDNLCGFCCFGMRFVVFVDLFGTIILPATFGYLVYLIYLVASHTGQFPLISIVVLAAVYGLQALIFILKRQWQHIGWMIIYLLAFPIYSFVLPVYSFWKQDDFSWGNTRVVLGEKGMNVVVAMTNEEFDPRSIPLKRWDDYAIENGLPGRRRDEYRDEDVFERNEMKERYRDDRSGFGYEMDDMHSRAPSRPQLRNRDTIYSHSNMSGFSNMGMAYARPVDTPDIERSALLGDSASPGYVHVSEISDSELLDVIRRVLGTVDLDTTTKKALRSLVERELRARGVESGGGEMRERIGSGIDAVLAEE